MTEINVYKKNEEKRETWTLYILELKSVIDWKYFEFKILIYYAGVEFYRHDLRLNNDFEF